VSGIDVLVGQTNVSFYYKDTLKGTPTLTVSSVGLVSAIQPITISSNVINKVTFITSPQTIIFAKSF